MNRRLAAAAVIIGLLVLGLLVDAGRPEAVQTVDDSLPDQSVFPMAGAAGALSSTWFCAGGTADEERFADHVIDILNPTDQPMTATVTVFAGVILPPSQTAELDDDADSDDGSTDDGTTDDGSTDDAATEAAPSERGEPVVREISLGPRTRDQLRLGDIVDAPIASALVEGDEGGLLVEHEVASVHGRDAKPCAASAAPTWHFAWGDTSVDARELLVFFNPFPDAAVVDGVFVTEDGTREPGRFDGLPVPAHGVVAVDLGDEVTRRDEVAATFTTRSGRVVVDRILRVNGDDRGLTVQTGIPVPQETWVYPDGFSSETVREEMTIFNPSDDDAAEVEIEVIVDDPETNGIPDPFSVSLPPRAATTIDLTADGRLPDAVAHATVVRSVNGVPIVSERVLYSDGDSRRGVSVTTGSPVEAEQWTFVAGEASGASDEWLIFLNLDAQVLAQVDVFAVAGGQLVPVTDLQSFEIGPGQRRAVRIGEKIQRDDLALLVRSSEPVVVERSLYRVGAEERGVAHAVGIPSQDGLRVPIDPLSVEVDADLGDDLLDGLDGDDDIPTAPDDVELPEPDETIVIDDPDAEVDPTTTTTTAPPPTNPEPAAGADPGVPDTTP